MNGGLDLYWLPLGAGGHSVRFNGRVYEALVATIEQRRRCDLYHSALEARTPDGRFVIEMAPVAGGGDSSHGAVAGGAVGSPLLGWSRLFRYEIRCWRDGRIPDVAEAVESPRALSDDPALSQRILDSVPLVPTPTWGRDELRDRRNVEFKLAHLLAPGLRGCRHRANPASRGGQGTRMGRRHCHGDASARAAFARPTGRGEDMTRSRVLASGAGLVALAAMYRRFLRRPILTWGATPDEAAARLPGDELLEDADGVATRAITIEAPCSAVWPWIAQMGPSPRGGAYTYDWIENLLGLHMHSTGRVIPEFQHPKIGDGFGLGANRMSYAIVDPERVLAIRSADGNWVWTFVLDEQEGETRLISRNRFRLPRLRDRLGMIPMEPGSLVMERKMLLGIKQRAERLACEQCVTA